MTGAFLLKSGVSAAGDPFGSRAGCQVHLPHAADFFVCGPG